MKESGFVFTDEQFGHRGAGTSEIGSDGAESALQAPLGEDNTVIAPVSLPTDFDMGVFKTGQPRMPAGGTRWSCALGFDLRIWFLSGSLLLTGCDSPTSDFETFMQVAPPANVQILKMDGNWGNDPWRCWELSPADEGFKSKLIAKWNLAPHLNAFHGVASGGKTYCHFEKEELSEGYSGDSDSYRAVGIIKKTNSMVVYFYNG